MNLALATQRLKYHFEPEKGWMNDPNGLIQYKGLYHAFYQHSPWAPKWNQMHWGHAISKDLVHWTNMPIALAPDMWYENDGGCFSGSAIEHEGKMHLFYTCVSKELGQSQCKAVMNNDGSFTKSPKNPIIPTAPSDVGSKDFRDPKVIKIGDSFYMVTGTGKDGIGKVILWKSSDLETWEYKGVVVEGAEYGICCECPDLMRIGDEYFLMFSQMSGVGIATMIWSGKFENDMFVIDKLSKPIIGPDFYAPQSFEDEKGRRIVIGWLYNWKRQPPQGIDYAGALTIPCEMKSQDDGTVKVFPVEEARNLLAKESKYVEVSADNMKMTIKSNPPVVHNGKIERIDILEDTKTVEVWINGGEYYYSTWII